MSILTNRGSEQSIVAQALLQARVKKDVRKTIFDRDRFGTYEESVPFVEACRGDFGLYGEYVFGYPPAAHHRFWIDLVRDLLAGRLPGGKRKLLVLAPPNSAKSTWLSQVFPTHYLGVNPSHSVLFFTSSDIMAGQFGTTVRLALQQDPKHQFTFPEENCRPYFKRGWSSEGLYLKGRPLGEKDPSYRALGYGAQVVGARANLIILDDPLDQQRSMSETEQKKAKEYYDGTVEKRLQPDGVIICVTTRWHELDLASHFISRPDEWHVVATPMVAWDEQRQEREPDPLGRAPGELLWADRFGPEFVEQERSKGIAYFNCVYQCDPSGVGGDVFEDSKWFRPLPDDFNVPGESGKSLADTLYRIQAWDMAFSERDRACYTASVTIGVDQRLNIYILNVFRRKMSAQAAEDAMVDNIARWKPRYVAVEDTAFKHAVTRQLVRRLLTRVFTRIEILTPEADKVARARLPAARAEAGMLFVDQTAPWYPTFLAECLGFPNTAFKDQVDALALACHAIFEQRPRRDSKPVPVVVDPDPTPMYRRKRIDQLPRGN